MHCPLCSNALAPLSAHTNDGRNITIDHCRQCGGTWFDPYETIGLPYHEVVRLADETVNPKTPTFSVEHPSCPRCKIALEPFHGDAVPAGVAFFRCSKCRGIWATQRPAAVVPFTAPDQPSSAASPPWSVLFVPTISMVMLAFTTILTIGALQQSYDARTSASQQVSRLIIESLSPTAVAVSFRTNTPMKSSITIYGDNGYALTQDISEELEIVHGAVLTDLPSLPSFRYEIDFIDAAGRHTRLTGTVHK